MNLFDSLAWVIQHGGKVEVDGEGPFVIGIEKEHIPDNVYRTLRAGKADLARLVGLPAEAVVPPVGMSLGELMEKEFAPLEEYVPGIITQGVSLVAAKSKIGKTWFVLGTGLALASGGMALGKIRVSKVGVLVLALEDGERRLQDRFALLLDGSEIPDGFTFFTKWPRLDAGGAAQLDAYLAAHPDVKVVFIDTLAKIRPARRKGGDLYAEDYAIGEVLKEIAEKRGVAIVLVYHTRKASAGDPLDEIRDTMGLTGGVDNCLVLRRARGQADAELFVSGRDIAVEKGYALTWDAITAQWIIKGDASEYAVSTARKQVLDALDGAPDGLTPTEVARTVGKPLSAVKKLMWTMSKDDTLTVTEGRYRKRGNRGNPVTVNPETLTEQGERDTDTVTSRLPNVRLSNRKSNRADGEESSNSKENGCPVTTVTTVTENASEPETDEAALWGFVGDVKAGRVTAMSSSLQAACLRVGHHPDPFPPIQQQAKRLAAHLDARQWSRLQGDGDG